MKQNALVTLLCLFAALSFRVAALDAPPALAHNGRVYFLQDDDNVVSIDLDDPPDMKRYPDRNDYSVAFVPVGGDVAVITDGGDTTLFVDGATGEVRWTRAGQRFLGADGGLPVFERREGDQWIIEAVEPLTNEAAWEARLSRTFTPESVVVMHDRAFLLAMEYDWEKRGSGTFAHLLAVDRGSGETLWDVDLGDEDANNWLLLPADGKVCLIATGFDGEQTVRSIRFWNADGEDFSVQPPVAPDGTIPLEETLTELGVREAVSRRERKSWFAVRYQHELRRPRRDSFGNPVQPVAAGDEFHTWTLRDGSVFQALSIEQATAWDAAGNPVPSRGGQRIRYKSADGTAGWEGVPGYMNTGQANPVLWVEEDGDSLVFACRLGQVECLDRRTGASQWIYTYPAEDGSLDADGRWLIGWWSDPFTARLRRYAERAAGKGITGTAVVGEAVPERFRIVTLAEEFLPKRIEEYSNNGKYPYMIDFRIGDGGRFSVCAAVLMLLPLAVLLRGYRTAGRGTTTRVEIAYVCYLFGAFLLFVFVGGYSPVILAVTGATFAATAALYIRKKILDGKFETGSAPAPVATVLLRLPLALLYALLCFQLTTNIPALIGSVVFMIAGAFLGFKTLPV